MDDNGNFMLMFRDGGKVFLHSAWKGEWLPEALARAVELCREEGMLNDPGQFTRHLACAMMGDEFTATGGFGIATYLTDNDRPLLVVDCENARFGIVSAEDAEAGRLGVADWRPLTQILPLLDVEEWVEEEDGGYHEFNPFEWDNFTEWFRSDRGRK